MNCPRCNAVVAFSKNQCDNCGQSLVAHRKIVSMSNAYYNYALSQAKVRDLSGAIRSLKQSLEFNKCNTSARNLLGLIYYETGEVVAALGEWVLSRHYQESGNDAEEYIKKVQSNPNRLEMLNQSIKKYNSALFSAQHGDEDMAIIQLKKVIALNPNYIRAHQLLALLYMMSGRRENRQKAYRLLRKISQVDVTNTTTLRYLQELSDLNTKANNTAIRNEQREKEKEEKERIKRQTLPAVDPDAYKVITPYKEERPSIMPFVFTMIGVVIGIAIMYFMVIPQIKSNVAKETNAKFTKYSENQAASDSNVSTLKNENEKLETQVKELEQQIEELQGGTSAELSGIKEVYEALVTAVVSYQAKDKITAAETLIKINEESLTIQEAKDLYKTIKDNTYEEASEKYFMSGRDAYNGEGDYAGKKNYDKSIKLLTKSLSFNKDNTDAMYFLGRCYQQKSDPEQAKSYYQQILDNYPDSDRVGEAKSRMRELGE